MKFLPILLAPSLGSADKVKSCSNKRFQALVALNGHFPRLSTGAALLLSLASVAIAAPGDLDTTFGAGGKATTSVTPTSSDLGRGVALQSDGKILVAGSSYDVTNNTNFAVARYTPGGAPDSGFGSGGMVTTDFGSPFEDCYTVAVQSDGKILVGGVRYSGFDGNFALARYTPSGELDSSFGNSGKVFTDFGTSDDVAKSIAVQPDGKIILVGQVGYNYVGVARYTSSGVLDNSFGTGGKVQASAGNGSGGTSVVLQSDGKIVVAGESSTNSGNINFAVFRFLPNGTPDAGFGNGGSRTTDFNGGSDSALSVTLQSDGKILAAGAAAAGNQDFGIARYLADGTLDGSFGTGGKVTTDFGGVDSARFVAVQDDGMIVVAGFQQLSHPHRFALARYLSNGSLDQSFGSAGKALAPVGSSSASVGGGAMQSDGKVLLAGYFWNGSSEDFVVARFERGGVSSEIQVSGNATNIVNGDTTPSATDHTDFGTAGTPGGSIIRTFTISNSGTASLSLGGTPRVAVTGSPAFSVTQQPAAATVAPGGTVTFQIAFAPSSVGLHAATVSIACNDADENPFTFALAGTGMASGVLMDDAFEAAGLSGDDALAAAIPFDDGVENLLKYAFNMNLSGPDARTLAAGSGTSGLPAIGLTGSGPATMIRVEFLRRKGSGLIYTPKRSSTLAPGSFTPIGGTPVVTSINDNWERVVVQESANPATLPSSFAIVEVTLPSQ